MTTSAADIAAAVDRFLATPKRLVGSTQGAKWAPGYSPHEVQIAIPLEIDFELTGAKLLLVGFPRSQTLKFRLGILFPGCVCRLDYTDEKHPNSFGIPEDGVPPFVAGPHYHSWPINRRFCRGGLLPQNLHNAVPFDEPARSFDAVLRWFCADNRIEGLPGNHGIELPTPDVML